MGVSVPAGEDFPSPRRSLSSSPPLGGQSWGEPVRDAYQYIHDHRPRFLDELFLLLRQPSISAQDLGVKECAQLLKKQMEDIGVPARILPTAGRPVVFGEIKADARARTVLIYGHYDVQPPDPLELWQSPPFELCRRLLGGGV